jgi:hypothetical protein
MNANIEKAMVGFRTFWSAPDVVQKVGIIGAGVAIWPLVVWLIWIVQRGGWDASHQTQQLNILGNTLMGSLGLLGLVIIALLGVVKGVKAQLPGGASFDLDIDNSTPAPSQTVTQTVSTTIAPAETK